MTQVKLNVSNIGGLIQTANSGNLVPAADGTITVNSADVPDLLRAGAFYVNSVARQQNVTPAPRAAAAGESIASVALANGTLTIAHQPDVMRLLSLRIDPGTSAITAGNVALSYRANDGTIQTDNLSAITAASTVLSQNTTKAAAHINSTVVTGLVGGASPVVQVDETAFLGLAVDPGFQDFAVFKENVDDTDETVGSVIASAAAVSPTTAPNATHTFGFAYSYIAANF